MRHHRPWSSAERHARISRTGRRDDQMPSLHNQHELFSEMSFRLGWGASRKIPGRWSAAGTAVGRQPPNHLSGILCGGGEYIRSTPNLFPSTHASANGPLNRGEM